MVQWQTAYNSGPSESKMENYEERYGSNRSRMIPEEIKAQNRKEVKEGPSQNEAMSMHLAWIRNSSKSVFW